MRRATLMATVARRAPVINLVKTATATLLASGGTAGNNTSLVSASVSWAAGDLIIVPLSMNMLSTNSAWTCTATGLTFTASFDTAFSGAERGMVFTALAASGGSSAVTLSGVSTDADAYQVIKVTPVNGTLAVGTIQSSGADTGGATNSLGSLTGYDANDYQIAFTMASSDSGNYAGINGTPRAGWTEIGDTVGNDTTNWAGYVHSQISPQGGESTASVSTLNAGATTRMVVLPIVLT